MKTYLLLFAAAFLTVVNGCKKESNFIQPPQPPAPIDDVRTVLLKDVVAHPLPSPYYHFTYDNMNYVKQISYASDYYIYNVEYENKRVRKMTNIILGINDSIIYSYSNNLVTEMNEFSGRTGKKRSSYRLFYNSENQLTQLIRIHFSDNGASDTAKKTLFTYHPDGNLATVDYYYYTPGTQPVRTLEEFSNYDNNINVDDFDFLRGDFFENVLFLPQVKLQKNNPQKHIIIGTDTDYDVTYTYQYQNGLPVKKTGLVTQTRGTGQPQPIEVVTEYTYY